MTDDTPGPLGVSDLARRGGLTPRAVRHYDRIGLLTPASVDPGTGYRWYAPAQVGDVRLVARLRGLDVPVVDVRRCLESDDRDGAVREVLSRQRDRLQARATRLRGDLHSIEHLLVEGMDVNDHDASEPTAAAGLPTAPPPPIEASDGVDHRRLGIELFNATWTAMGVEDRDVEADDRMAHMAHASAHHWAQVGTAVHRARSEWQCSRVYAVLRRAEPAAHHARRVLEICTENGIGDFDLAFAYEAQARAAAVGGDPEAARAFTELALEAAAGVAEDGDRELLLIDLETIPGQPRFW